MDAPGTVPSRDKSRRRPYFVLGIVIFVGALAAYVFQTLVLKQLATPWYVPIMGTIAVLFMLGAVVRRRSFVRIAALAFFALLMGLEWFYLVVTRTPQYTGPARAGANVPAFAASFADGAAFTDDTLRQGKPTLLVFFRGRW